jgi:CRP-like cAMP-binding protein
MDQAESILDQLLKFTGQLAELENDPQVDAKALSDACIRRLDDLKRLMPQKRRNSPVAGSEVLEKMRDLYTRTQVCLEILERKNNRVAARLQSLSRTRQAISAYNTPQGRNR